MLLAAAFVESTPSHKRAAQLFIAVNLEFSIAAWSAYAPGITTPELWCAWAQQPVLPVALGQPDLAEMAPMLRRRLAPLGRMAAQVAFDVHDGLAGLGGFGGFGGLGMPVVLGSRYGDAARSLELLSQMVQGEAVSPTAFGLSVHNAIGAMYSIARADRANYVAVSAGLATVAASIVEAVGLLRDGAPEVLVICYDAPLPGVYAHFESEPKTSFAWAWRLVLPRVGLPRLGLSAGQFLNKNYPLPNPLPPVGEGAVKRVNKGVCTATALPRGLDVLRFMLAGDGLLTQQVDQTEWTWRRYV
jgi:Beta-ketoacyl synthase, N-terminal domain